MSDISFPPLLREIDRAGAYSVSRHIIIHSLVSRSHGPSVVSPPFIFLGRETNSFDLGSGILKALDEAKASREQPAPWGTMVVSAEKSLEIEWLNSLIQNAYFCTVERSAIAIAIVPTKKWPVDGKVKGYAGNLKQAFYLPLNTSEIQVGKGLLNAFEMCE